MIAKVETSKRRNYHLRRNYHDHSRWPAPYLHAMMVVTDHVFDDEFIPPEPICLICGVTFFPNIERPASVAEYLRRDNQWKDYLKPNEISKNVMVPSKEVEAMHVPEFPALSFNFSRAGFHQLPKSCLTGINIVNYSMYDTLYMPKDVDLARIGYQGRQPRLENNDTFVRFYSASIAEFKGKAIGCHIHAHCWALLNQTLGATTFSPTELQKFIRAARKWHKNKAWGIRQDDFWEDYPSDDEGPYGTNVQHSPFIIPAIQSAIELISSTNSNGTSLEFTKLPLELRMMIVQFVCPLDYKEQDLQNTRNMLSAFGWILPESFWRLRLSVNDHLLFELNSLKETSLARWQFVCLDVMSILRDREDFLSSGLANRERILRIIDGILGIMEKISCRKT